MIWLLVYGIAVTAAVVVASGLFVLFYLVFVILVFRIIFMFLCKSRRVNTKNAILANSKKYAQHPQPDIIIDGRDTQEQIDDPQILPLLSPKAPELKDFQLFYVFTHIYRIAGTW